MLFTEEELKRLPELYSQDGKGDKAKVGLVVKLQNFIWLLTEYDKNDLFFGFVCLNNEQNAELGYISKTELEDLGSKYPLEILEIDMELGNAKDIYIFKES